MNIAKREEIISLYDAYYNLLTAKQRQYFEQYYFDDLSISEIASNLDVSRNAVFDQIKRVVSILEDYEKKLNYVSKIKAINELDIASELKTKIIDIFQK